MTGGKVWGYGGWEAGWRCVLEATRPPWRNRITDQGTGTKQTNATAHTTDTNEPVETEHVTGQWRRRCFGEGLGVLGKLLSFCLPGGGLSVLVVEIASCHQARLWVFCSTSLIRTKIALNKRSWDHFLSVKSAYVMTPGTHLCRPQ
jgi:hypothetical protein